MRRRRREEEEEEEKRRREVKKRRKEEKEKKKRREGRGERGVHVFLTGVRATREVNRPKSMSEIVQKSGPSFKERHSSAYKTSKFSRGPAAPEPPAKEVFFGPPKKEVFLGHLRRPKKD